MTQIAGSTKKYYRVAELDELGRRNIVIVRGTISELDAWKRRKRFSNFKWISSRFKDAKAAEAFVAIYRDNTIDSV